MEFDVNTILRTVYGVRGLPFPANPDNDTLLTAAPFDVPQVSQNTRSGLGTPLWGGNALGRPVFMPATLDGLELQNPLITITGEKSIIETDVVNVGTVTEKVFTRPYAISIIVTCINAEDTFPEEQVREIVGRWQKNQVLTLECALTDYFLQSSNNFLMRRIALLDMQGVENAQVIQIDGTSNVDFELELIA